MTTRDAKRAVRLRDWGKMVKQCQKSGLTVSEWCIQNNLKPACYYYRLSAEKYAINQGIDYQNGSGLED